MQNGITPEPKVRFDCSLSSKKAYIHSNTFGGLPNKFHAFFNPKNASETNTIKFTPPSVGQFEKRTSSRATDVLWH